MKRRALRLAAATVLALAGLRAGLVAAWPRAVAAPERWHPALEAEALRLRDERVLVAPAAGALEPLAGDGQWVRQGEPLFRVVAGPGAGELVAAAERLRREREELERRLAAAPAAARREEALARLRAQLDALRAVAGTPAAAAAWRQVAETWAAVRAAEAALADALARRARLEREAAALAAARAARAAVVRAPAAGAVEWAVDGLEVEATPAFAADPDPARLRAWLEAGGAPPPGPPAGGAAVAAGQPLARLVPPGPVWLAAWLPGVGPGELPPPGRALAVALDGGAPLRAEVAAVRAGEGGAALVVALREQPPGGPPPRRVRVRLLLPAREGQALPADALHGGRVAVRGAGGYAWHPVRELARGDGRVLVEGLAPGVPVARWAGWLDRLGLVSEPGR